MAIAVDKYKGLYAGNGVGAPDWPVTRAADVTPSDTEDLAWPCRAIQVNVAGNVKMTFMDGGTVTRALLAGVLYPFRLTRVFATNTTATGIAIYD